MYEAFDSFLNVATWHTKHEYDDKRFNLALNKVVREAGFDPDEMAGYFRSHLGIGAENDPHPFHDAIQHRQQQAVAVQSFLRDIREA
jgi:hypothetical protein